ncbi:Acetyltransferase (GNAT) domain-containing protein [Ruminococcaceae bacterium YRB3002]|nr:Acetyltransferase (GNAT) domain-containing protein [Ruminococcaceae bacterium YRB3002]
MKHLLDQVDLVHHLGRPDHFKIGRKYNDAQLLEIFEDEQRPVFVAVSGDDIVVGYCFCIINEVHGDNVLTDMKTLYIDDLCVDETCRGSHVGKALYEYTRSYARDTGCYNVTLNVWECNPGARAFYDNMGLHPLKTYMEDIL